MITLKVNSTTELGLVLRFDAVMLYEKNTDSSNLSMPGNILDTLSFKNLSGLNKYTPEDVYSLYKGVIDYKLNDWSITNSFELTDNIINNVIENLKVVALHAWLYSFRKGKPIYDIYINGTKETIGSSLKPEYAYMIKDYMELNPSTKDKIKIEKAGD